MNEEWDERDLVTLRDSVLNLSLLTREVRTLSAKRRPPGVPSQRSTQLASSLLLSASDNSTASGLQHDEIIEALKPMLEQSEARLTKRIEQLHKLTENNDPEPPEKEEGVATAATKMLNVLTTCVKARVKLSELYNSSVEQRTVWMGGVPNHVSAGSKQALEKNMRAFLAKVEGVGEIQSMKARYKDPGAEGTNYGPGSGQSWCLVVFASIESAFIALNTPLKMEGDRLPSLPAHAKAPTVILTTKPVDSAKVAKSPIGQHTLQLTIQRLGAATERYSSYLPKEHPTLLRMLYAQSQAYQAAGDETEAQNKLAKAEKIAKALLEEWVAQSGGGSKRDYRLWEEDIQLCKKLVGKSWLQVPAHKQALAKEGAHKSPSIKWAD